MNAPALQIEPLPLPGLHRVRRAIRSDDRGDFARLFDAGLLAHVGWGKTVQQVNHSTSQSRGTVRGLHFQAPPYAEAKLVSCVAGEVWDVAVDLRAGSPTFLQWHAEVLTSDNAIGMLIPAGFAHGFQALSENASLIYVHDGPYRPEASDGIHPMEPRCNVQWPLPVAGLSSADTHRPKLAQDFAGITP